MLWLTRQCKDWVVAHDLTHTKCIYSTAFSERMNGLLQKKKMSKEKNLWNGYAVRHYPFEQVLYRQMMLPQCVTYLVPLLSSWFCCVWTHVFFFKIKYNKIKKMYLSLLLNYWQNFFFFLADVEFVLVLINVKNLAVYCMLCLRIRCLAATYTNHSCKVLNASKTDRTRIPWNL